MFILLLFSLSCIVFVLLCYMLSSSDSFSWNDSVEYFNRVLAIQQQKEYSSSSPSFSVSHETHRGRILSNPFITLQLIHR